MLLKIHFIFNITTPIIYFHRVCCTNELKLSVSRTQNWVSIYVPWRFTGSFYHFARVDLSLFHVSCKTFEIFNFCRATFVFLCNFQRQLFCVDNFRFQFNAFNDLFFFHSFVFAWHKLIRNSRSIPRKQQRRIDF